MTASSTTACPHRTSSAGAPSWPRSNAPSRMRATGCRRSCWSSGDAGIGKTTIVSESAARAGVALYLGRSTHIGGDTIPLAPLADLLRQVRRTKPDLLTETPALAALQHWFAPGAAVPELHGSPHGGLFVAVLELITQLAADDGRDRRVRRPALGRHGDVGSVRVPRPQPDRRAGGAGRHLPCQRGRQPPEPAGSTGRADPAAGGASNPPGRAGPRRDRRSASPRCSAGRRRARSSTRWSRAVAATRSSPASSSPRTCRARPSPSCSPI